MCDNAALQYLENSKSKNSTLARYAMVPAAFDFKVKHRAGKNHGNADGLSRAHQPTDDPEPFNIDVMEALLEEPDMLDPDYLLTSLRAPQSEDHLPPQAVNAVGPQQALLEAAPCAKCK